MQDVVEGLGYTALGTRFKRIGERLQAQTLDLSVRLAGIDMPAGHNTVLAALDRHAPMRIGELADALGQSQPGVTRMIGNMKRSGLVEIVSDDKDQRISRVRLTDEGERVTRQLKEVLWPAVEAAVTDLCSALSGSLLDQLGQIERALAERPLNKRVRIRVKAR